MHAASIMDNVTNMPISKTAYDFITRSVSHSGGTIVHRHYLIAAG